MTEINEKQTIGGTLLKPSLVSPIKVLDELILSTSERLKYCRQILWTCVVITMFPHILWMAKRLITTDLPQVHILDFLLLLPMILLVIFFFFQYSKERLLLTQYKQKRAILVLYNYYKAQDNAKVMRKAIEPNLKTIFERPDF